MKAILDLFGFTRTVMVKDFSCNNIHAGSRIDIHVPDKGEWKILVFKYHHMDGDAAIFYCDCNESGFGFEK